jgi:hypothetical protein
VPKEVLAWRAPYRWQLDGPLFNAMLRRKTGAPPRAKIHVRSVSGDTHILGDDDDDINADAMAALLESLYLQNAEHFQERVALGLKNASFPETPLILPASFDTDETEMTDEALLISLNGLSLVDVDNVSWENIIDVRDDPLAMRGLQGIRDMFIAGKELSASTAEDEIGRVTEAYEAAARAHGLPTVESKFGIVVSLEPGIERIRSSLLSLLVEQMDDDLPLDPAGAIATVNGLELGLFPVHRAFELLTHSHPFVISTGARGDH